MGLGRSLVAWLLILVFAVFNGGLREAVLIPALSTPAALMLSGALLSACIVMVAVLLAGWLKLGGVQRSLSVGLVWLCVTLAFEFGFGRLVQGLTWSETLAAYTFEDGNIWPVVLVVTFFAPLLAGWLRRPGRGTLPGSA
jgi:hypothetical protein